jgi:hypothetical protein
VKVVPADVEGHRDLGFQYETSLERRKCPASPLYTRHVIVPYTAYSVKVIISRLILKLFEDLSSAIDIT